MKRFVQLHLAHRIVTAKLKVADSNPTSAKNLNVEYTCLWSNQQYYISASIYIIFLIGKETSEIIGTITTNFRGKYF